MSEGHVASLLISFIDFSMELDVVYHLDVTVYLSKLAILIFLVTGLRGFQSARSPIHRCFKEITK